MGYAPSKRLAAKRRAAMHAERKRTGVALGPLLAGGDAPEGFDEAEVEAFYRGLTDRARLKDLKHVKNLWAAMPARGDDPSARRSKRKDRIELTPAIRAELRRHWMRVGVNMEAFFERLPYHPPGLSASLIRKWVVDTAPRRVRKDHLELVLITWKKLPDDLGTLSRIHFVPFEAEPGGTPARG